jgi:hypothetical protein
MMQWPVLCASIVFCALVRYKLVAPQTELSKVTAILHVAGAEILLRYC